MSKSKILRIIIVGEGAQSESLYIQSLNQFLREKDVRLAFDYASAGGGDFDSLSKASREQHQNNPRREVVIWADEDRYVRNEAGDANKLSNAQARGSRINILFNRRNFEDFLCMHFDDAVVQCWQEFCQKEGHFDEGNAMTEGVYLPLFKKHVCPNYSKGFFEYGNIVNEQGLKRLFEHNKDEAISLRSEFADFMEKAMAKVGYRP